jgi:hypothetical protein
MQYLIRAEHKGGTVYWTGRGWSVWPERSRVYDRGRNAAQALRRLKAKKSTRQTPPKYMMEFVPVNDTPYYEIF